MVTGIETVALSGLAPAAAPASVTGPGPVTTDDLVRFQNAMAAGPSAPALEPLAPAAAAAAAPAEAANPALAAATERPLPTSLGDAILGSLDSASTQLRTSWTQATQLLEQPQLLMSDVVRLQMTVLEASIQYELLSKGISKANQSLDQLLRTQ